MSVAEIHEQLFKITITKAKVLSLLFEKMSTIKQQLNLLQSINEKKYQQKNYSLSKNKQNSIDESNIQSLNEKLEQLKEQETKLINQVGNKQKEKDKLQQQKSSLQLKNQDRNEEEERNRQTIKSDKSSQYLSSQFQKKEKNEKTNQNIENTKNRACTNLNKAQKLQQQLQRILSQNKTKQQQLNSLTKQISQKQEVEKLLKDKYQSIQQNTKRKRQLNTQLQKQVQQATQQYEQVKAFNEKDRKSLITQPIPSNYEFLQNRIKNLKQLNNKIQKSCKDNIENQSKFLHALAEIKENCKQLTG